MEVIGAIGNVLFIHLEGARIIVSAIISNANKKDLVEYGDLKEFKTYQEIEDYVYGPA